MTIYKSIFPKRSHLWHGAILRTIAHAISIADNPTLSYEVSWEKQNYTRQDSMGSRGAITFAENFTLGAFFDEKSARNPFRLKSANYDLDKLFIGIPVEQLSLLKGETLQYLLEKYKGDIKPVITSAFWSVGEYLTASESWNVVYTHGGHLIRVELMDQESALDVLKDEYELSSLQFILLQSLFAGRITTAFDNHLVLNKSEYGVLISNGISGLKESKQLLQAINIKVLGD